MKLQKTTWVLLILALSLSGFVYFYEIQGKTQREELQQQAKKVFNFQEEDIKSLIIEKDGKILEFEHTDKQDNKWQMKQPENFPASDAAISFLTNLLANSESSQSFNITEKDKVNYGLDKPFAIIKVKLKNNENYQLNLGKESFDKQSIYVQKPDLLTVFIVPINFKYAVERDLEEWKKN